MGRTLSLLILMLVGAAGQQTETRRVDFARYGDERALAADWEMTGGRWTLDGGSLQAESAAARAFASYVAQPVAGPLEVTATITVAKRSQPESWVTAGVCVYLDSGSFWQLALVEGPDGRRYAELVEMHNGTWQAQREGVTKLEPSQFDGQFDAWEYGNPYRLRLKLDEHEVRGEIADVASGRVRTTLAYVWGGAPGVKEGRPALATYGLSASFEQLQVVTVPPSEAASPVPIRRSERGAVALLDDPSSGLDRQTIDALGAALEAAGFGVTRSATRSLSTRGPGAAARRTRGPEPTARYPARPGASNASTAVAGTSSCSAAWLPRAALSRRRRMGDRGPTGATRRGNAGAGRPVRLRGWRDGGLGARHEQPVGAQPAEPGERSPRPVREARGAGVERLGQHPDDVPEREGWRRQRLAFWLKAVARSESGAQLGEEDGSRGSRQATSRPRATDTSSRLRFG